MSDIFLFKTENQKELKAIKEELMMDLTLAQQDQLLKKAWSKKYNFLLIKGYEPTQDRYYINFDKVVFPKDEGSQEDECENTNLSVQYKWQTKITFETTTKSTERSSWHSKSSIITKIEDTLMQNVLVVQNADVEISESANPNGKSLNKNP